MDVDQDEVNLLLCISHCEADDFSFVLWLIPLLPKAHTLVSISNGTEHSDINDMLPKHALACITYVCCLATKILNVNNIKWNE